LLPKTPKPHKIKLIIKCPNIHRKNKKTSLSSKLTRRNKASFLLG